MIKNVPNRIDADTLASLINEVRGVSKLSVADPLQVVPNSFDFLYLRIDFSNNCNVGCTSPLLHSPFRKLTRSRRRLCQLYRRRVALQMGQDQARQALERLLVREGVHRLLRGHPGAYDLDGTRLTIAGEGRAHHQVPILERDGRAACVSSSHLPLVGTSQGTSADLPPYALPVR